MKNYKNYLIAILSGLLVLSLSTQQAQSAGTSKDAKIVQYAHCLNGWSGTEVAVAQCKKYQP